MASRSVCAYVYVLSTLYTRVFYFWEPCSPLKFKATGNGKWFAILQTEAEVRRFVDAAFQQPHHIKALNFSGKCARVELHEMTLEATFGSFGHENNLNECTKCTYVDISRSNISN